MLIIVVTGQVLTTLEQKIASTGKQIKKMCVYIYYVYEATEQLLRKIDAEFTALSINGSTPDISLCNNARPLYSYAV